MRRWERNPEERSLPTLRGPGVGGPPRILGVSNLRAPQSSRAQRTTETPKPVEPAVEARPGTHADEDEMACIDSIEEAVAVLQEMSDPDVRIGDPLRLSDREARSWSVRAMPQGGEDPENLVANGGGKRQIIGLEPRVVGDLEGRQWTRRERVLRSLARSRSRGRGLTFPEVRSSTRRRISSNHGSRCSRSSRMVRITSS